MSFLEEMQRIDALPPSERPHAYLALNDRMRVHDGNPLLHSGPGRWEPPRMDGDTTIDADQATKTSQGLLRVPVRVAKAGVVQTVGPDGEKRRELRTKEELGAPDTLASLNSAPVTMKHPEGAGLSEKTADLIVGHVVAGTAAVVGALVSEPVLACDIIVTDPAAIRAVERDKLEAVMGYSCKRTDEEGTVSGGGSYDSKQADLRIAYIALVPRGTGEKRLRLDGGDVRFDGDIDPEQVRAEGIRKSQERSNGKPGSSMHTDGHWREPDPERVRAEQIRLQQERSNTKPGGAERADVHHRQVRIDSDSDIDPERVRAEQIIRQRERSNAKPGSMSERAAATPLRTDGEHEELDPEVIRARQIAKDRERSTAKRSQP